MTEIINIDTYPLIDNAYKQILLDNFIIKISLKKDLNIISNYISNFIKFFKDLIFPKYLANNENNTKIYTKNINSISQCKKCKICYYEYSNIIFKDENNISLTNNIMITNTKKYSEKPLVSEDFNKQIINKNCKCTNGNISNLISNISSKFFNRIYIEYNNTIKLNFYNNDTNIFHFDTNLDITSFKNNINKNIFKSPDLTSMYKLSYYFCDTEDIYIIVSNIHN